MHVHRLFCQIRDKFLLENKNKMSLIFDDESFKFIKSGEEFDRRRFFRVRKLFVRYKMAENEFDVSIFILVFFFLNKTENRFHSIFFSVERATFR